MGCSGQGYLLRCPSIEIREKTSQCKQRKQRD